MALDARQVMDWGRSRTYKATVLIICKQEEEVRLTVGCQTVITTDLTERKMATGTRPGQVEFGWLAPRWDQQSRECCVCAMSCRHRSAGHR